MLSSVKRANTDTMKRSAGETALVAAATAPAAAIDTPISGNDLSILRKPIKTSVTGFNEARRAYEDGTEEVKRLLSNECDIIYECKVCRNMFRSLVNFISHKRIYCQNQFNAAIDFGFGNDGPFSQDLTTIVQAENDYIKTTNVGGKSHDKDLGSIIERLAKREQTNRMMKLNDFYEQVNRKLTQNETIQQQHILQLDHEPETNAAVYQTVKTVNDGNIKTEVNEIDELLLNEQNVLGPDGKIVSLSELPFGNNLLQNFECEICNSKYSNEKTLKLHIQAKHIPSTYVYPCPTCSRTFLRASLVIRHLTNDHKKSISRIRQMRATIHKRRVRLDEVQIKGPSRELTRLQTDKERDDAQNKAWLDNLDNPEGGSICTYCGKKFDRRAVLISHTKVCQNKIKPNHVLVTKAIDHDESSNSNSFDAFLAAEENVKAEPETVVSDTVSLNKRKRKRAYKAMMNDDQPDLDDEKSSNVGSNADATENVDFNEHSESATANDADAEKDASEAPSMWNIILVDDEKSASKSEETAIPVKEIKIENKKVDSKAKSKSSTKCTFCHKLFSNTSNLRRHIQSLHFRQRRFVCKLCKTFRAPRRGDVIHHLTTEHEFFGDKTEALEFICVKEEVMPSTGGSSRRKNRHIDLLKDETEEVGGNDPDESADVTPMDTSNENSNVEFEHSNGSTSLPLDSATDEDLNGSASSKRKGRPKGAKVETVIRIERSHSVSELMVPQTRRPVRNRTMPVKEGFVYDLATLLKKDPKNYREQQPQSQHVTPIATPSSSPPLPPPPPVAATKSSKSRNSSQNSTENSSRKQSIDDVKVEKPQPATPVVPASKKTVPPPPIPPPISSPPIAEIKGSAHTMALEAVTKNRATFYKPPEIPTTRPLSAPVKIAKHRELEANAIKDWRIVKKANQLIQRGGSKTVLNFKRNGGTKLAKRLASKSSSSNKLKSSENILNKMNGKSSSSSSLSSSPAKNPSPSKNKNRKLVAAVKSASESSEISGSDTDIKVHSAPVTPTRRMTLLERLAENKTKKLNETMGKPSIGKTSGSIDKSIF